MGVEVGKTVLQGGAASPKVSPEGHRGAIADRDRGKGTEDRKPSGNVLPDMDVKVVRVPEVPGVIPAITTAEPVSLGGRVVRVELCEKYF
jgi:hypothetical protein